MDYEVNDQIKFTYRVFSEFVEQFGLDDWETSIDALECFTQSSSAEFAIRLFLISEPGKTIQRVYEWVKHESVHVRRFASEGTRPRLPWAMG